MGKTTLVKSLVGDWAYLDLDDPVVRPALASLTAQEWLTRWPRVVIDEVQKLPALFETMKACHDRDPEFRAVLLGSSQVLVQKGVRESLAGRAAYVELFPLSLSEIVAHREGKSPQARLRRLLGDPDPAAVLTSWVDPLRKLDSRTALEEVSWDRLKTQGGMPALWANDDWTDSDKSEWLEDYVRTYLQKDLADSARLDHLEPFVRLLRLACLRTGQMANWSDLAREAGISSPSAKAWTAHLETGYLAAILPPWFRNQEKRLSKTPKLHVLDSGVRRAAIRRRGELDGSEFETAVVAEFLKTLRTERLPLEPFHLRTSDGREVDLLLEREDGFVAVECKSSIHAEPHDARHLLGLDRILGKPVLASLVVSDDPIVHRLVPDQPVWAVPASFILS